MRAQEPRDRLADNDASSTIIASTVVMNVCENIVFHDWDLHWNVWSHPEVGPLVSLQWEFGRPDAITGEMGLGQSSEIWFPFNDGHSEGVEEMIVRRAFMLALQTQEHETREFFRYKGIRPFNPHQRLATA